MCVLVFVCHPQHHGADAPPAVPIEPQHHGADASPAVPMIVVPASSNTQKKSVTLTSVQIADIADAIRPSVILWLAEFDPRKQTEMLKRIFIFLWFAQPGKRHRKKLWEFYLRVAAVVTEEQMGLTAGSVGPIPTKSPKRDWLIAAAFLCLKTFFHDTYQSETWYKQHGLQVVFKLFLSGVSTFDTFYNYLQVSSRKKQRGIKDMVDNTPANARTMGLCYRELQLTEFFLSDLFCTSCIARVLALLAFSSPKRL